MKKSLKITLHDYAGHGFIAQLSRALARRGYHIDHYYAEHNPTPRGDLIVGGEDPDGLRFIPVSIAKPFQKYSLLRRWMQEREYGRALVDALKRSNPDVVISAQTPLDTQAILSRYSRQTGITEVLWVQDLIGIATDRILRRRMPVVGSLIGAYYIALQKRILQSVGSIIVITEDFVEVLKKWGIDKSKVYVILNWASIEKIPPAPLDNSWSRRFGLQGFFTFLYTGTLGFKHNPSVLLRLAEVFQHKPDVKVVVVSEGPGGEWLEEEGRKRKLGNLLILPFQPMEAFADVLASGDVLIAILEPDAGVFSVPSKVLSYLCAGRPILASIPSENLAAKIIQDNQSGLLVNPEQPDKFIEAAKYLYQEDSLRKKLGENGRRYAEAHFDIEGIADQFEQILHGATMTDRIS